MEPLKRCEHCGQPIERYCDWCSGTGETYTFDSRGAHATPCSKCGGSGRLGREYLFTADAALKVWEESKEG